MSRRIADLRPPVYDMCTELVLRAAEQKMPVIVCQTLRTLEEQAMLYAKGRTRPGPIVTYAKPGESAHNYGLAFDCVFVGPTHGSISWNGPWEELGALGKMLGLAWGGDFPHGERDNPHFELPDWRERVKET